jgi:hypothetical protein
MVTGAATWTDTGQHDNFDFVACQERVSEDQSELGLTEGHMLSLRRLGLLGIEHSQTLF